MSGLHDVDDAFREVQLGLVSVLLDLLASSDSTDQAPNEAVLEPVISAVADELRSLGPKALFIRSAAAAKPSIELLLDGSLVSEHSEPTVDGGIALGGVHATTQRDNCDPANVLKSSSDTFWSSALDVSASSLRVQLPNPVYLSKIDIQWHTGQGLKAVPESYEISVAGASELGRAGGQGNFAQVGKSISPDSLPPEQLTSQTIAIDAVVSSLRIDMKGLCKSTPSQEGAKTSASMVIKEKCHAIRRLRFWVPSSNGVHVAPGLTMLQLQQLLLKGTQRHNSESCLTQSLTGLMQLGLVTGSLHALLQTVQALITPHQRERRESDDQHFDGGGSRPSPPSTRDIPRAALPYVQTFADALVEAVDEEVESHCHGAAGNANLNTHVSLQPRFDPDTKSSSVTLQNHNTSIKTGSSEKCCVYGLNGFKVGRAAWEFRCDCDNVSDECFCYGAATKPMTSSSYDSSSSNLFVIRAYNGYSYSQGSQGKFVAKIRPNDVVRFELDCAAGEIRCRINTTDHGVVFSGLKGKEVFPAMASYGSNRTATFTKLECWDNPTYYESHDISPNIAFADLMAAAMGLEVPRITTTPAINMDHLITGHYCPNGILDPHDAPVLGSAAAPSSSATVATPIVVNGVKRPTGFALFPRTAAGAHANSQSVDGVTKGGPGAASVTMPLTVPIHHSTKGTGDAAAKPLPQDTADMLLPGQDASPTVSRRPYEFFVGRVAVDDSTFNDFELEQPTDGPGTGITPVIVRVYGSVATDLHQKPTKAGRAFFFENTLLWESPPMHRPTDSHFVRVRVTGFNALTITASPVPSVAAAGAGSEAKKHRFARTVWCDAKLLQPRDWSWCDGPRSSICTGTQPPFVLTTAPSSAAASSAAVGQLSIGLARFILSRLCFASEAYAASAAEAVATVNADSKRASDGTQVRRGGLGGDGGDGTAGAGAAGRLRTWLDASVAAIAMHAKLAELSPADAVKCTRPSSKDVEIVRRFLAKGPVQPFASDARGATFTLIGQLLELCWPLAAREAASSIAAPQPTTAGVVATAAALPPMPDPAAQQSSLPSASSRSSATTSPRSENVDAPALPLHATRAAGGVTFRPGADGGAVVSYAPASISGSQGHSQQKQYSDDGTTPWTSIVRYLLRLLKSHFTVLSALGTPLASLGIRATGAGIGYGDGAKATDSLKHHKTNGKRSASPHNSSSSSRRGVVDEVQTASHLMDEQSAVVLQSTLRSMCGVGDAYSNHVIPGLTQSSMFGSDADKLLGPDAVPHALLRSTAGKQLEPSLAPVRRLLQAIVDDATATASAEGAADSQPTQAPGVTKPTAAVQASSPVSLHTLAAEVMDAGLPILYPTPEDRRALMGSLMARGATVEVHFRFPALRPLPAPEQGKGSAASGSQDSESKDKKGDGGSSKKDNDKDKPKSPAADDAVSKQLHGAARARAEMQHAEAVADPANAAPIRRDPRFDRAILCLQMEVERLGWRSALHGTWGRSIHLLVEVPPSVVGSPPQQQQLPSHSQSPTGRISGGDGDRGRQTAAASARKSTNVSDGVDFLERGIARAFDRAGFPVPWSVPGGCPDPGIPLKIERFLDWTALERDTNRPTGAAATESASSSSSTAAAQYGIARVYPRAAAAFDDISDGVQRLAMSQGGPLHHLYKQHAEVMPSPDQHPRSTTGSRVRVKYAKKKYF